MPSESDYIDPSPIAENARLTEAALEEKAEKDLSNLDATVLGQKIIDAVKAGKLTADDLGAVAKTLIGAAGGVAALGADGKVPTEQLPAMDYDAKGSASAVQSNLNAHVQDTTAHITDSERNAWTGKAAGTHASQHAADGSDPVTPAAIGAAVGYRYTATIPATGWSESAPYTQQITVSGVTAAMTPVVDVVQSADADAAALQLEAWACVSRIVTGLNKITVYCYEKTPETNVPVQLVGVV